MKGNIKISEYFGLPRAPRGTIGIEIEREGIINHHNPFIYWDIHNDQSLHNGVEYVLHHPVTLKSLDRVFEDLTANTFDCAFKYSSRTSVHIHYNACKLNVLQVYNIVAAFWILESIFLKMNGKDREGNIFCLRGSDAEYINDIIIKSAKTFDITPFGNNNLRYAALNLCSLPTFGSIEYRFIKGTTDNNLIKLWCKNLTTFSDFAKDLRIDEILNYANYNVQELIKKAFDKDFINLIKESCDWDNLEQYYIHNIGRILELNSNIKKYFSKVRVLYGEDSDLKGKAPYNYLLGEENQNVF